MIRDGLMSAVETHGCREWIEAFRRQYPKGDNFVVSNDIEKPYKRMFGDLTVKFESLGTLIGKI